MHRSTPCGKVPTNTRPIIAVLGSTVSGGTASPALRSRLEAAADQWHLARRHGVLPVVVCLGGIGGEGTEPEAPVMASIMESLGVPRDMLIEEAYSRTTEENLLHLRAMITDPRFPQAWAGKPASLAPDPRVLAYGGDERIPVTLVTSRFHVPRTLLIARHIGFIPRGVGAPDPENRRCWAIMWEAGALLLWGARTVRRSLQR